MTCKVRQVLFILKKNILKYIHHKRVLKIYCNSYDSTIVPLRYLLKLNNLVRLLINNLSISKMEGYCMREIANFWNAVIFF